jgi:hypothetical protein
MKKSSSVFLLSVVPIAVFSACNTDPAFKETSRSLTNEEISSANRKNISQQSSESSGSEVNTPDSADAVAADGSRGSQGSIDTDRNNDGIPDSQQQDGIRDGIVENMPPINDNTGSPSNPGSGTDPMQPTPQPTQPPLPPSAKPGQQVVHTTTQQQGKVDVLWVVDDSGSMKWAQDQLTGKFESFARKLTDARVNFQVGVTSTDVCQINWSTGRPMASAECPDSSIVSGGAMVGGKMVGPLRGEFITDAQSGEKVMKNGSNFVEQFKRVAKVGIEGSSMEHGLSAAKMAIEKSLSGVNQGFLRNDAFLSVVVLSDEEDDGVQMWCEDAWGNTTKDAQGNKDLNACKAGGGSRYLDAFGHAPFALSFAAGASSPMTQYKFTADNFKSYLENPAIKGVGKFRVSAITGIRGQDGKIICNNDSIPYGSGPRESGTNYIKAAQLTGGVVENICAQSWDQVLSNIGKNIGELANKVALPAGKKPYPGTLEVRVDGVIQPASAYFYESQGNFVVFKVIPESGAEITVKYKETVL